MSSKNLSLSPQELPTFGRVGFLTPEQETTLKQFRLDLEASGTLNVERHDDHTLLRFLRARKFVLAAAKKMIDEYGK